ncbi:hypothetical protein POTOM_002061 [Populus tomentosa]|uniref:Uncharacterized protein n=1 Tax=Populus tomentosa TaxID=118781 RepID=A0A8X8DJ27_POPTO|nr:hypothetical protein POTOM_002061 [Populus tomentosa]
MQEIKGAKKFIHVDIKSSLKNKFDRIYFNIIATRAYTWALSSGVPAGSDVDPSTSNANIAHDGLEEESGDSEEDVILDFQNDMARMLLSRCNHLFESMSTKSDSTSVNMDREGCSIRKVMAELHSILGVSIEDEFHDFVTEYLSLRKKREMWASMGDKQQKLRWLQRIYA